MKRVRFILCSASTVAFMSMIGNFVQNPPLFLQPLTNQMFCFCSKKC